MGIGGEPKYQPLQWKHMGADNHDEDTLADRVAALENTVEQLESQLAAKSRDLDLLAVAVDVDPVDANCPVCEDGKLHQESGLSWSRAVCENCGKSWYL